MKRPRALLLVLSTGFFGCAVEQPDPDPDERLPTYRVTGRAISLDPARPPPAAAAMALTLREAWVEVTLDGQGDPFPADAPILDRPELRADLSYETRELEETGSIVALYLDDAPGQPDDLVKSIVDHRVDRGGEFGLNPPVVWRASVERWAGGLSIEGSELEAAGMMILFYLDGDGRPLAGVSPAAFACDFTAAMLSDDLTEVLPDQPVTGASGAVLFVGAPASLYGYRVEPGADGDDTAFLGVGAGTSPSTLFVETLTVDDPDRAVAGGRLPPEECDLSASGG